ncbi:MAG TPA: DUF4123 domain-containing protein [Bacteroidia bacterium]|nr:DUF4123 domain-containing protein [Bacteroidia bacterium]
MNSLNLTCVILDAARIFGEIDTAQKLQSKFLSLYKEQNEELLSSVAPHLFQYQSGTEFSEWLLEKGWGNAWGVFVISKVGLEDLQNHFRKFLMVKTEDGKELFFRFYDPRVLRIFLPTCNESQLEEFFGPVESYLLEDDDPSKAIRFKLVNKKLHKEYFLKEDFLKLVNSQSGEVKPLSPSQSLSGNQKNEKPNTGKGWSFMVD